MSRRFQFKHTTLRNMDVNDSDGYTVTLDGTGQGSTDSEHTAALLARLPKFTVTPEPTPYEALPPRPPPAPARTSQTTSAAVPGGNGPRVGDMGIEFSEEDEIPNAPVKVQSPKDSPEIPEVVAARLRLRYEADADLVAIARGLMDPVDLVAGIVKDLDPRQHVEAHEAAFPEVHARLQELERYRSEQEAFTSGLQDTIDGLRAELEKKTAPAAAPHHEEKAPAKRK